MWAGLATLIAAICKSFLQAWQGHQDAEKVGEQKQELDGLKAADASVDKAVAARTATAASDADANKLHDAEQSDPDCRDCK
jgi:hypothetical protein